MLSCTTLHVLLRPQQSAMVRTRSMGRKWVLRACGRALFADIAARYMAGVENFDFPGPALVWEPRRGLGLFAAQRFSGHVRVCLYSKRRARSVSYREGVLIRPGCFLYLYRLAESRGFDAVVHVLEEIWARAGSILEDADPTTHTKTIFRTFRASTEIPIFSYQPLEDFPDLSFYPNSLSGLLMGVPGAYFRDDSALRKMLAKGTGLLGPELLAVLYYLCFLNFLHSPSQHNCPHLTASLPGAFDGMLDLQQQ